MLAEALPQTVQARQESLDISEAVQVMPTRLPTPPPSQSSFVMPGLVGEVAGAERRNSLRKTTARVGGIDGDSQRPTKRSRIATPPDSARSPSPSKQIAANVEEDVLSDRQAVEQSSDDPSDEQPVENNNANVMAVVPKTDYSDSEGCQSSALAAADAIHDHPLRGRRKARRGKLSRLHIRNNDIRSIASPSPALEPPNQERENSQSPQKGESGQISKRLPGRRRAHHADVNIEVLLRRQLELKVSYRAVTKALKPILAELAERTARELEADTELYKNYEAYADVEEELNAHLERRLRLVEDSGNLQEARLNRMFKAEQSLISAGFRQKASDLEGDYLLRAQNELLEWAHTAENMDDSDATDLEDGVVPTLYRPATRHQKRRRLDAGYDSRSRFFVETANRWQKLDQRCIFQDEQHLYDENSLERRPKGFATFDPEQRTAAVARWKVHLLIEAVAVSELPVPTPPPPTPPLPPPPSAPPRVARKKLDLSGLEALVHASEMRPKLLSAPPNYGPAYYQQSLLAPYPPAPPLWSSGYHNERLVQPFHNQVVIPHLQHGFGNNNGTPQVQALEKDARAREIRFLPPLRAKPARNSPAGLKHAQDTRHGMDQSQSPARPTDGASLGATFPHYPPPLSESVDVTSSQPLKFIHNGPEIRSSESKAKPKSQQQIWSPFTNSMGPTMTLPKYARPGDIVRGNTTLPPAVPENQEVVPKSSASSSTGRKKSGELPVLKPRPLAPAIAVQETPPPPSHPASVTDSGLSTHTDRSMPSQAPSLQIAPKDAIVYFSNPPPLLDASALPQEGPHRPHTLYSTWQSRLMPSRKRLGQQYDPLSARESATYRPTAMGPPPPPGQNQPPHASPHFHPPGASPSARPRLPTLQPQLQPPTWPIPPRHHSLPTAPRPRDNLPISLPPIRPGSLDSSLPQPPQPPPSHHMGPMRAPQPGARLPPLLPLDPAFLPPGMHPPIPRYREYALPPMGPPGPPRPPPGVAAPSPSTLPMTPTGMAPPGMGMGASMNTAPASSPDRGPAVPMQGPAPSDPSTGGGTGAAQRRGSTAQKPKESERRGKNKGSYTFKGWVAPVEKRGGA